MGILTIGRSALALISLSGLFGCAQGIIPKPTSTPEIPHTAPAPDCAAFKVEGTGTNFLLHGTFEAKAGHDTSIIIEGSKGSPDAYCVYLFEGINTTKICKDAGYISDSSRSVIYRTTESNEGTLVNRQVLCMHDLNNDGIIDSARGEINVVERNTIIVQNANGDYEEKPRLP